METETGRKLPSGWTTERRGWNTPNEWLFLTLSTQRKSLSHSVGRGPRGAQRRRSFKSIAIPRFYKKLGGDDRKQGDTILYCLEHKWKKPMSKTPQQHYHRTVELFRIAEKLNKSQPTPNKEKKKLLFFHAMPLDWQTAYKSMGRSLDDEDLLGRVLPFHD
jgi:hypothetical protein